MTSREMTIALAGNPNSGKSTVFNNLTGVRQHVGNWPGVTVEKKEGFCPFQGLRIRVVDLPGVYSLTAYSLDEVIARDYIVNESPDVVVDVVDASNLERNLYLTVQLLEMKVKMVIALNMMDIAESRDFKIDVSGLSHLLGAPIVPLVAARNQGTPQLLEVIKKVYDGEIPTSEINIQYGHDVEVEIAKLEKLISDNTLGGVYSPRWLAVKLLEDDREIIKKVRQA